MSRGVIIEPDENGLYGGVVIYGPDGITPISSTNPLNVSLTGSNVILPSDSLASGNGQRTVNQLELFDGTNWNQYRGNTQGTLLASATRTSQIASPITTNYNSKGVFVAFNITAASGTGGLQLQIYGVDPAGGPPILLLNATSVTTTGQRGFIVYPGASGGIAGSQEITQTSSLIVPRQFYVYIGATDGSSYTYSVGYSLIN